MDIIKLLKKVWHQPAWMFECLLQSFQSNFSFEILGVSTSLSVAAKISSLWEPYLIETKLKSTKPDISYDQSHDHSKNEHVVRTVNPIQVGIEIRHSYKIIASKLGFEPILAIFYKHGSDWPTNQS